jgi:hypothetical protein
MQTSFNHLIDQIDAFIRKYYKNQLIKGSLLFVLFFLLTFLFTSSLEFFGRFPILVRGILFFSFIVIQSYLFIRWIATPLSRLWSFGKRISHIQAADIIGSFFPEVADKLKNTIQLQKDLDGHVGNLDLIAASISQRASQLSIISFESAIEYKSQRQYLKYLLPVLLGFITVAWFVPQVLTQGSTRVIQYSKEFKEPNPYVFIFNDLPVSIEEGKSVDIKVKVKPAPGFHSLPKQLYIVLDQGKFLMKQKKRNTFSFKVSQLQKTTAVYLTTNEFNSQTKWLRVNKKAVLGTLKAYCNFPKYLNKPDRVIENASDLTLPEGTVVRWELATKNTKKLQLLWQNEIKILDPIYSQINQEYRQSGRLKFVLTNAQTLKNDTISSKIEVIKDAQPAIEVVEEQDSLIDGRKYFQGTISDDYGLSELKFVYTIEQENGEKRTQRLAVEPVKGTLQKFDFAVDFRREKIQLSDVITYYFVVYDNDGVNGHKATKSETRTYELPSLEELNDLRKEEQTEQINQLEDVFKKTQQFQKDVQQLKKEAIQSKSTNWNKLNKVEQLQQQQLQLQEQIQESLEEIKQSTDQKNQLSPLDEQLLEKQELLEQLLNEVMDDELKELLKQLEEMLKEQDKDQMKEKLDELQQSTEDMNKQLDRSLELLKKMQVNERIDDLEKELDELAKQQDELKEENQNLSKEDLLKKQQELNQKFDEIKKELNEVQELNKDLARPLDLDILDALEEQVSTDLQNAEQEISDGKSKKAAEKQKSAADGMKAMSSQLNAKQKQSNKQQEEEDMESLRALLEGLIILSFDQEKTQKHFTKISTKDPVYRKLGRRQQRINDDTKIIRDSLLALAKRQPKIATFIDAELHAIETQQKATIEAIDDHKKKDIEKHQQLVMTSYNNLALLLNEALQSMQQQMNAEMQGSGSCENPGKGRPKPGQSMSSGDMKEMLKKQLEQMQKGSNPGGNKPGKEPGQAPGASGQAGQGLPGLGSKELARMAAEQTAIRQRLEQLKQELNKEGKGLGNQLNPLLKELEEQEKDLLLKRVNPQTIQRQKEILTRLLESENAIMKRGYEEKREAKSGKDPEKGNQIRFEEYKRSKWNELELIKSIDPALQLYYKQRSDAYLNQ